MYTSDVVVRLLLLDLSYCYNGRSVSSSQSDLCRLELKTDSIKSLENFVTIDEYL